MEVQHPWAWLPAAVTPPLSPCRPTLPICLIYLLPPPYCHPLQAQQLLDQLSQVPTKRAAADICAALLQQPLEGDADALSRLTAAMQQLLSGEGGAAGSGLLLHAPGRRPQAWSCMWEAGSFGLSWQLQGRAGSAPTMVPGHKYCRTTRLTVQHDAIHPHSLAGPLFRVGKRTPLLCAVPPPALLCPVPLLQMALTPQSARTPDQGLQQRASWHCSCSDTCSSSWSAWGMHLHHHRHPAHPRLQQLTQLQQQALSSLLCSRRGSSRTWRQQWSRTQRSQVAVSGTLHVPRLDASRKDSSSSSSSSYHQMRRKLSCIRQQPPSHAKGAAVKTPELAVAVMCPEFQQSVSQAVRTRGCGSAEGSCM
jgi:hypothetical protein